MVSFALFFQYLFEFKLQARAVGAVILTTDHAPMNELVDFRSGIIVTPFLKKWDLAHDIGYQ
jgi:hypothetical protein